MKKILVRHWSYVPTGPILASLLIVFWFLNQGYLAHGKGTVNLLLENPFLTFGLIIFGAFISAFISGEFSIKTPLTYEPLAFSLVGGIMMGVGAVLAAMSVHSIILFNLAGIFTLTAFMITQGWIYVIFMVLGGLVGSKLLIRVILKTERLKKEFSLPRVSISSRNQRILFYTLVILFIGLLLGVLLFSRLALAEKFRLILGALLLTSFGLIVERGTICMSSMLKEWFLSHSAYVWKSVLFTVMCLALFYKVGMSLSLYQPIEVESYIQNISLLIAGSFLMGFGFIFADGCFIGSLWKAGEGNVINMVGILGILIGIGGTQFVETMLIRHTNAMASPIPNYLNSVISPWISLIVLWALGILFFIIFKQKRYRY